MLVPSKEPVSLTNRTHTAGVHQNAVLNDASTYEAHPLDLFGVSETEILLGPLSGWNIIHYFLKEIRYFEIDEATAKKSRACSRNACTNWHRIFRQSKCCSTLPKKNLGWRA